MDAFNGFIEIYTIEAAKIGKKLVHLHPKSHLRMYALLTPSDVVAAGCNVG